MTDVLQTVAEDLKLKRSQVESLDKLLKEGNPVPFIARYRKDIIGALDEARIRKVKHRLDELNKIEQRRALVLKAIQEAGQMTPEMQTRIEKADKIELEDLYIPYKARRRVRSAAARQKGLEGLADLIWPQGARAAKVGKSELTEKAEKETAAVESAPQESAKSTTAADGSAAPSAEAVPSPEKPAEAPIATAETPAAEKPEAPAEPAKPAHGAHVEELVKPYINPEKGVKDMADALTGARDCVAERIAEDADCRKIARDLLMNEGKLSTKSKEGIDLARGKFAAYAKFSEPLTKLQSYRLLALMRASAEKQLSLVIESPREKILQEIKSKLLSDEGMLKPELALAIEESFDRLLMPALDNELRREFKLKADQEACEIYARNFRALLMQPAFGEKSVLAIEAGADKSLRAVALDEKGKLLAHAALHPEKSPEERLSAGEQIIKLVKDHNVKAVAIANGPNSREIDTFVREALKSAQIADVPRIGVSENGATQYAGSPDAREEFSELEPPFRSTVFVGRKLQNPLAQLIKVEPTTLNLGAHQHDTDQDMLKARLEEVVESCVNQVGAEVNDAGKSLLRFVSGLNTELAKNIVEARKAKGAFKSREELREVPGMTAQNFEQSAGFQLIRDDSNPLDHTRVHPAHYAWVETLASSAGTTVKELIGNEEAVAKLDLSKAKTEPSNEHALKDIQEELKKPARDPRGEYVPPQFNEELQDLKDLKDGMVLNGIVSSLTPFGAFVNIGVHQDGLVHISAITHKFIRDPSEVLSLGQPVKVKVASVDVERKRISLSMKELEPPPPPRPPRSASPRGPRTGSAMGQRPARPPRPRVESGSAGSAVAAGQPSGEGSSHPSRPPRSQRSDRPRGPRPPGARFGGDTRAGAPAMPGAPGEPAVVAGTLGSGPRAPSGKPGGGEGRRGDRRGPPREDRRGGPPAKPVKPGMPDYSKFFVKSKRNERGKDSKGPKREESSAASRDEVRQVLRDQQKGGTTLADLLRKAGVATEEKSD